MFYISCILKKALSILWFVLPFKFTWLFIDNLIFVFLALLTIAIKDWFFCSDLLKNIFIIAKYFNFLVTRLDIKFLRNEFLLNMIFLDR